MVCLTGEIDLLEGKSLVRSKRNRWFMAKDFTGQKLKFWGFIVGYIFFVIYFGEIHVWLAAASNNHVLFTGNIPGVYYQI